MAIAGEQPHALAVALDDQAIAIMLDLVDPSVPVGTFVPRVGMQGSKMDLRMRGNIGRCGAKCESETAPAEV